MKLEWFQQQNPQYKERSRRILSTACQECFIDIMGWARQPNDEWQFMSIGMLSNHDAVWKESWKGRFYVAWKALRGRLRNEIEFDNAQEVDEFIEHLQAVKQETFK